MPMGQFLLVLIVFLTTVPGISSLIMVQVRLILSYSVSASGVGEVGHRRACEPQMGRWATEISYWPGILYFEPSSFFLTSLFILAYFRCIDVFVQFLKFLCAHVWDNTHASVPQLFFHKRVFFVKTVKKLGNKVL